MRKIGYDYNPREDPGGEKARSQGECSRCSGEIYSWEEYGVWAGETVCRECLLQEWEELTWEEKFRVMGYFPRGGEL